MSSKLDIISFEQLIECMIILEVVMSPDTSPTCDEAEHPPRSNQSGETIPQEAFNQAASIFRALGDVNRLRILTMLGQEEMCVSDIAGALEDNISAVSQRLKLLRSERIVKTRREGKHIYYRLADQHIKALIHNALEHAMED